MEISTDHLNGFLGGVLIGAASLILLAFNGRIFGVSGIVSGILSRKGFERDWRIAAVLGLLSGGILLVNLHYPAFDTLPMRSFAQIALAGLLVGFGTRLGRGCTSGHGVCGVSRLSPRAIVATCIFMVTGMATATFLSTMGSP